MYNYVIISNISHLIMTPRVLQKLVFYPEKKRKGGSIINIRSLLLWKKLKNILEGEIGNATI
ncbi:MAG TPA: hypothetical protein DDW50_20010 [Firmicutes bacterium]|nr:hypothetical protein [Bacillota bacterium]